MKPRILLLVVVIHVQLLFVLILQWRLNNEIHNRMLAEKKIVEILESHNRSLENLTAAGFSLKEITSSHLRMILQLAGVDPSTVK